MPIKSESPELGHSHKLFCCDFARGSAFLTFQGTPRCNQLCGREKCFSNIRSPLTTWGPYEMQIEVKDIWGGVQDPEMRPMLLVWGWLLSGHMWSHMGHWPLVRLRLLGEGLEFGLPSLGSRGVITRGCNLPIAPLRQVSYQLCHLTDSPSI